MELIGHGIYSYSECARILGVSTQKVRGWFVGWPLRQSGPLLSSDCLKSDAIISFLDLVEAAVAATLNHKHNVPIQTVRKLRRVLKKKWNTKHPFARQELYADDQGREVFCEVATEDGESHLLELLKQQFAIRDVVFPFLKTVEYSDITKYAEIFGLMGRVVLDPTRKFGKPVVRGTGMPTSILFNCFLATKDFAQVADWYNVEEADVEEAVHFEREFVGIAA